MKPMLLVTINLRGIVFPTEVNGHVDQALDTTDCAVRVLHAMQRHGLAVQQILVADTSARVYGAVLDGGCPGRRGTLGRRSWCDGYMVMAMAASRVGAVVTV
jgi:hypothetical protein